MVSTIDDTQPQTGVDQPVAVIRNNFIKAKLEIEELQDTKLNKSGDAIQGVLQLFSTTVADLPDPTTNIGGTIFVIDATPLPVPAYSNGVNWLTYYDNTIIS